MAELFGTSRTNVIEHINNIYLEEELDKNLTCQNFRQVQKEGNRTVSFYNLDMIISLGYRIKSKIVTNFRRWATDYQKARIIEKENQDREELEKQKREKYNPNAIFKDRNTTTKDNEKQLNEEYDRNLLIEVQRQNIFQRLLSFIKKLIRHY